MQGRDDRSLGELFSELAQEPTTLVRHELNLAKVEMGEKASRAGKHAGVLAAGGAVAYAGLLAILAGAIILLNAVMPLWVAAVFGGGGGGGGGDLLGRRG